jgi:hypothetical protein
LSAISASGSLPASNSAIAFSYWLTPPEGPMPKRVQVLRDYLIEKLAQATVAEDHGRAASGKAMNRWLGRHQRKRCDNRRSPFGRF